MRRYFEAEMRMLREAGEAYAEAHPEQARSLGLASAHDRDPYVERLLEGFAFLTAQIRQRIDAAAETTANDVLDAVAPDLVGPYPASTVVAYRPARRQRGQRRIPAGSPLMASPDTSGGMHYEFRTRKSVDLMPLELESFSATETAQGRARFELTFQYHGDEPPEELPLSDLPVFLDMDRPMALTLHRMWRRDIGKIEVESSDGRRLNGAALRFEASGLEASDAVNAGLGTMRPALRYLQDYFGFRSRYLFLSLQGLDRVGFTEEGFRRFHLRFESRGGLPRDHRLTARNIQLFCTPAVNLFPCEGRPLTFDGRESEFELHADSERPGSVQVHSVDSVHARGRRSARITPLKPLRELIGSDDESAWYATERRESGKTGLWLRMGGLALEETHTLSLALHGTQGNLPRRHMRADSMETGQAGVRASSLFRPTPMYQPTHENTAGRLNALLKADLETLLETDTLLALLTAVEWTESPDNRSRIRAVESVTHQPFQRISRGILHTGVSIAVELNEECGFAGMDDIHLFGEALHAFFSTLAPVNQSVRTRLVAQPSGTSLQWPL